MVLVGPSGCGKTTALRMLAGLEEISDGEIRIGDRVVNDLTPKERDIAMVFQSYALYPHMTVEQNLAFGLKLRKLPKTEIKERVRRAAEIARDRGVPQAQAARALRRPAPARRDGPRDRPRAAGVPDGRAALEPRREAPRADARRDPPLQRRLGVTTIYVTHDQVEAMTLGDRVAVMRDGHLQQVATPQALYEQPTNEFVAGFIGSPVDQPRRGRARARERRPGRELRRAPSAGRRRSSRDRSGLETTSAGRSSSGSGPRTSRTRRSSRTRRPTGGSRRPAT